jgi:hypothetical protein
VESGEHGLHFSDLMVVEGCETLGFMGARFILPVVELGLDGVVLCVWCAVMLRRIRGRGLAQFSAYPESISSRDVCE